VFLEGLIEKDAKNNQAFRNRLSNNGIAEENCV
jgi:hypothetical protein